MEAFKKLENIRLLLVEDDEMIRDALQMVFVKKGSQVEAFETAEEGLEAMKSKEFDVVISDFRLPGVDGLDFMKTVKDTQPNTVRALVTAYRDYGLSKKAYEVGVHLFYEKPFSLKVLSNALADLLESRKDNGGIPLPAQPPEAKRANITFEMNASTS
jgi:DNA-binding NtrC family response regulator